MKKFLVIMLTLALTAMCLTGCFSRGGSNTGNISIGNSSTSSVTTYETDSEGQTYTGTIGRKMSNVFFDFTVKSVIVSDEFTVTEGNMMLDVEVEITNTFGDELPMFNGDFYLTYGPGEDDYTFGSIPEELYDTDMPESYQLPAGETVTYHMFFEVPAEATDFGFVYVEYFADETYGDTYIVNFKMN